MYHGVGEKTALNLIKEYIDIDKLYEKLEAKTDTIKGKLREKLVENKELAFLSRELRKNKYRFSNRRKFRRNETRRME